MAVPRIFASFLVGSCIGMAVWHATPAESTAPPRTTYIKGVPAIHIASAAPEPEARWEVSEIDSPALSGVTHLECIRAEEPVPFAPPHGAIAPRLCIRRGPRDPVVVLLNVWHGNLECASDCTVLASFDGDEHRVFEGTRDVNTMLEIESAEDFVRRLMAAHSLIMTVDFQGHPHTEIRWDDASGLNWPLPPERRRRRGRGPRISD